MQKITWLFIFLIAAGLVFSLPGFAADAKGSGKDKALQKAQPEKATDKHVASEKKTVPPSLWLNSKNFPWIQEDPCPFYFRPAPGC